MSDKITVKPKKIMLKKQPKYELHYNNEVFKCFTLQEMADKTGKSCHFVYDILHNKRKHKDNNISIFPLSQFGLCLPCNI